MDDQYLTIRAAVAIPACQAAVNGLFFGGAVGGIAATANHLGLLSIDAAAVAVAVGCTAALKAWSGLLRDWRGLLYGIDVDDQPGRRRDTRGNGCLSIFRVDVRNLYPIE